MKVSILGSTGSIGVQALEVIDDLGKEIEVVAISGNRNVSLLEQQIRKYRPKLCAVADEKAAQELKIMTSDTNVKISTGNDGLIEAAGFFSCDTVISAIVGIAGLMPTYWALRSKKKVALANKEALVTAGEIIMKTAGENNAPLLPVDSEHCAIFQCLNGLDSRHSVKKLILTASGGPFYGKRRDSLLKVSARDALNHPTWSMGAKITIDSATLMNKGLEILEAHWLFDTPIDCIDVVIHRESIVHSMVEFVDGSVMAQMSLPSMKHPIKHALTYPLRTPTQDKRLSLAEIGSLSFASPDIDTFSCLRLAIEAGQQGGLMPVVLNAANEIAVENFLNGQLSFLGIAEFVEEKLNMYKKYNKTNPTLEDIVAMDKEVRQSF